MATAGNLVTTIIGDLARSDTSLSDIVLIDIMSSIRDYEQTRFYFNEQEISVSLSATDTYALSLFAAAGVGVADIIEIDSMTVAISATRSYELTERTARELQAMQGNGIVGNPSYYAVFGQSLLIETKPTPTVLGVMCAHVKLTEIVAGGFSTTNVWTNEASELIRNATLKRLWGRRFRDPESAQMAAAAERDALMALKRKTEGLSGNSIEAFL